MAQREKFDRRDRDDQRLSDAAISRAESELDRLAMLRLVEMAPDPGAPVARDRLVDLACRIYDTRRTRSRYFHNSLLGEPVWDMLLALFCLPTARCKKMAASRLSEAAGLPLTTGLRWSKLLEQKGLIERSPDPLDARRIYVSLSDEGERLMCDYLSAIYHRMVGAEGMGGT